MSGQRDLMFDLMQSGQEGSDNLKYIILDPTGNITALVENGVEVSRQPFIADQIMQMHPEVEQVGFVEFLMGTEAHDAPAEAHTLSPAHSEPAEAGSAVPSELPQARLRMAGGEFCGNASMCAAALYLIRSGETAEGGWQQVRLEVSGASEPVEVRLRRIADPDAACPQVSDSQGASGSPQIEAANHVVFEAGVHMPKALKIEKRLLSDGGVQGELRGELCGELQGELPVVFMEGISHIIIEPDSVFFSYREERSAAERAVQKWCRELGADGLGLMFLDAAGAADNTAGDTASDVAGDIAGGNPRLTPLVYVPGSGTSFWENSCASGSAATGMYLANRSGERQEISLQEPGGILKVISDPGAGETWLYGTVR